MPSEAADYLINGISLNKSIKKLTFNNVNFSKTSLRCWTLCFALNTSIQTIESILQNKSIVTHGLNEETSVAFFHSLKYSKTVTSLTISNGKCNTEGILQLALCLETNHSLNTLQLIDMENLGGSVIIVFKRNLFRQKIKFSKAKI